MSIQNCVITFERVNGVFYSGELVRGCINLTVSGTVHLRELFLNILGDAQCRWEESLGRNNGAIFFTGSEQYFQTQYNLLTSVNAGQGAPLGSGIHTFDFSFQLPPNLPSTYEGTFGRIRYTTTVTIRQTSRPDLAYAANFTVLSNVDLNFFTDIMAPVKKELNCGVAGIFSGSGNVNICLEMPRRGYVSGNEIPVRCFVHNNSKSQIMEVKFYLLKIVEYKAYSPHTKKKDEITKLVRNASGCIRKWEQQNFNVNLAIPVVPPTTFNLVSMINVSYAVKLKLTMSGLNADIEVQIPITIGTIPLMQPCPLMNPDSAVAAPSFARIPPPVPPPPGITHHDSAPPSYEQAMGFQNNNNSITIPPPQQAPPLSSKYPIS